MGVAQRSKSGESSGDEWVAIEDEETLVLGVFDGLGHGELARDASSKACLTLRQHPRIPLEAQLRRVHVALAGTRGAAGTVVAVEPHARRLRWCGVGNVEAILVRAGPANLAAVNNEPGILGSGRPLRLGTTSLDWSDGDTLVLATDGLARTFVHDVGRWEAPEPLAARLLNDYGLNDDALVVALCLTSGNEPR